jgi:Fic family protein
MSQFLKKLQFNKERTQIIQEKIAQLQEYKGYWKGHLNISPQILNRLKKFTLITSTGASTRIEGSYLNDDDVKKLLSGLKIQKLKDRSQQEVAGYAQLTQLIFEEFKEIALNENTIKQLHGILLKYSEKDTHHKGNYKKGSNSVVARDEKGNESVIFNPTSPFLTPKEMEELTHWTNDALKSKEVHPLLNIAHFIGEFLAIHPFQDGNGRLSRALTNLLLLKNGFNYVKYVSLEQIIEERKTNYYLSLRNTQKNRENGQEDFYPWIEFFLDCLIEQTKRAQNILERKNIEDELSSNQLNILNYIRSSKEESCTIKKIQESTQINRNTIKKALLRLLQANLIKQIGLGSATRYSKI